ncbi:hypothetical protein MNBD_GAMMA22-466 [hydrothermal vent metagenome]|uniref:Uncharacterized protein n=1 Tax=hydrothermal vent metagenome TaxID=652676 RepID=A0A3B1AFU6_9ZZZZ
MYLSLKKYLLLAIISISFISTNLVYANEVAIEKAVFRAAGEAWSVDVTLQHKDTGWKHYADAWRIVDAKGNEIAKRTLYHPHVNEQPFTRSLSRVNLPKNTKIVFIEAHDTVHKWSPTKLEINLVDNKSNKVNVIY